MSIDPAERKLVARTLKALMQGREDRVDAVLRTLAGAFIAAPKAASERMFEELSRTPIARWYRREALDAAEQAVLWRRVRQALHLPPAIDPGGWDRHTTVIELGRLAQSAWAALPGDIAAGGHGHLPPVLPEDFNPMAPSPAGADPFGAGHDAVDLELPGIDLPAPVGAEPPGGEGPPVLPPPASPVTPPMPQPGPPVVLPTPAPLDLGLPPPPARRGDAFSFDPFQDLPPPPPRPVDEPPPAPRWLQGQARRPDALPVAARSLAPARWNVLALHIGDSAVPRRDAPVPVAGLDFGRGEVVLSVQVELAGARVVALARDGGALRPADLNGDPAVAQALVDGPLAALPPGAPTDASEPADAVIELASATLSLPRSGDSTLALFAVHPLPGVARISGRIALIHRSRVLQTARIAVAASADPAAGDGVEVQAEGIHPRDDDLEQRRSYDVAIQVSDVGGSLHLVVQQGTSAPRPVQLANLAEPIERLCGALSAMASDWDYAKPPLDQEVFTDGLFTLASNGAEIAMHLRRQCGDGIDDWRRIHLVPMTQRFFPLEYVYDGEPPAIRKSRPCPNLFAAMQAGSCDEALDVGGQRAACPHQRDRLAICPMHFWGLRRVIERNGTLRPEGEAAGRAGPVAVPSRQPWGRVRSAVLGATDRAFFYLDDPAQRAAEHAKLLADLRRLFGTDEARDWDDWRLKMKSRPNLLVLLVHTDEVKGTRVLEIGDEDLLTAAEIRADIGGGPGQPQLLLLIGCSAADVGASFQTYPESFRDAGVSIVLAPIAPLRGQEAVNIVRHVAGRIAQQTASAQPLPFGELLPRLRRELLAGGHPAVLSLVGFGDGDWLIGGP